MEEAEQYKHALKDIVNMLGFSGLSNTSVYSTAYNALYPKLEPQYTEIEKEYYIIVDKDGNTIATNSKPFNGKLPEGMTEVKLTGTFKHQVVRKVMKRVRLDVVKVEVSTIPQDAKVYAEWYEDEATK